jgi:hypothetical protein
VTTDDHAARAAAPEVTRTGGARLERLARHAYVTWCGDDYLNLFGAWDELREERRDLWRRIVSEVLRGSEK